MADTKAQPASATPEWEYASFDLPDALVDKYKHETIEIPVRKGATVKEKTQAYLDWYRDQEGQIVTPPKEQSSWEAFKEGLAKSVDDLGAGLKQGYLGAKRATAGESVVQTPTGTKTILSPEGQKYQEELDKLQQEQAAKKYEFETTKVRHPITSTLGEYTIEALPFRGWQHPLTTAAIEATKYGTPAEKTERAVSGGIGAGVGNVVARGAGSYVSPAISTATKEALQFGRDLGLSPRLSEWIGGPKLQRLENVAASMPGGQSLADVTTKNQIAANKVAARSIGITDDIAQVHNLDPTSLSSDVMDVAHKTITKTFNDVADLYPQGSNVIRYNQDLVNKAGDILNVQRTIKARNPSNANNDLIQDAQAIIRLRNKPLSGEEYNRLRSSLSDKMWGAEGAARNDYRQMLDQLDKSAEDSIRHSGNDYLANQLAKAREQYGNYMTLTKGNVVTNGDVNLPQLKNALRSKYGNAYHRTTEPSDLVKLAKFTEANEPVSGKATLGPSLMYEEFLKNPLVAGTMTPLNAAVSHLLSSEITKFTPRIGAMFPKISEPLSRALKTGIKSGAIAVPVEITDRAFNPVSDIPPVKKADGGSVPLSLKHVYFHRKKRNPRQEGLKI